VGPPCVFFCANAHICAMLMILLFQSFHPA
jgi:hypothetical protein